MAELGPEALRNLGAALEIAVGGKKAHQLLDECAAAWEAERANTAAVLRMAQAEFLRAEMYHSHLSGKCLRSLWLQSVTQAAERARLQDVVDHLAPEEIR